MSIDTFLLSSDTTDLDYPEIRPTLDLNFARVKALDPRITFTRSSGGSYVGADGLIKYAGVNEARFDHDPYTGESLGLLVEESRTNLLLRSEDFTTTWTNFNSTDASNTAIAPDGTTTADTLISNAGVTDGLLRQDVSGLTDNTNYTLSVFLKPAGLVSVSLQFFNKANTFHGSKTLNLSTGVLSGPEFVGTSSVVSYGNGWYRFILTNLGSGAGATTPDVRIIALSTGDGTSGLFLWGAQLEQGAFPTSYIPTEASTRTRAADIASITGKNFSDFYNLNEGTFTTKAKYDGAPISGVQNRTVFIVVNNNGFATIWNIWWESGNYAAFIIENPIGTYPVVLVSDVILINQTKKTALSYKLNDFAFTANGASPSLDTLGTVPSSVGLNIGSVNGTSWILNGTISRLTYYPKRLPNAQLRALTRQ